MKSSDDVITLMLLVALSSRIIVLYVMVLVGKHQSSLLYIYMHAHFSEFIEYIH